MQPELLRAKRRERRQRHHPLAVCLQVRIRRRIVRAGHRRFHREAHLEVGHAQVLACKPAVLREVVTAEVDPALFARGVASLDCGVDVVARPQSERVERCSGDLGDHRQWTVHDDTRTIAEAIDNIIYDELMQGKVTEITADTHPRVSPVEVLAKLRAVFEGGVQTGGNSSALVDAAAACVVASGTYAKANGKQPLARVVAASAVGVPPEIMGIGPAPAIRLLLERTGLKLADIARFEVNEAQGAQTLAVARELGMDLDRLNVNGGAIALGHPLAATGVRLTLTLARELQRSGQRYGIASACVGGGQGMALLIENPSA